MAYSFDMPSGIDPTDDGSASLPAWLGQALQFYGTNNSSPLPSYLSYPLNNQPGQSMFGGGAPLQAAMAPQAPDTPVAAAMAPPVAAQTPVSDATGQQAAPQDLSPIQQMFQNQATNPNMSMDNGLIAAGSAMLGAKDMKEGMAAAFPAFSNTFDSTLNGQRDLNTPKVIGTPADGAFTVSQMPGQGPQVTSNDPVQRYLLGKQAMQNQFAINKMYAQGQIRSGQQAAQQDRAAAIAAGPKVTQTDQALQNLDQALSIVNRGRSAGERAAAFSPTVMGALGYGSDNQVLARVGVDSALAQAANKMGAAGESAFKTFQSDLPKVTDSDEVWQKFITRNRPFLESVRNYYQAQAANGAQQGSGSAAATQAVQGAVPGTGTGAYKPPAVTDAASFAALPSGSVFQAPDGSIRRKP